MGSLFGKKSVAERPILAEPKKVTATPVDTTALDAEEEAKRAEARRKRISVQRQVPRSALKTRETQPPGVSIRNSER